MNPDSGAAASHGRHRLRTRLVTLAAGTALAAGGLAAPASALAPHTVIYLIDINGHLTSYDVTAGVWSQQLFGEMPVQVVASPDGGTLYFADRFYDHAESLATETDTAGASAWVCHMPTSEALDSATGMLYVGCIGGEADSPASVDVVNVSNPASYTDIASIPFADTPGQEVVDASLGLVFVTVDSEIYELSTATNQVVGELPMPAGTLTLNPDEPILYDSYGNTVYVMSLTNDSVFQEIPVPDGAGSTAICPATQTLYVSGDATSVINLSTGAIVKTLPESGGGLMLSPDCSILYEMNDSYVASVSTASGSVVGTVSNNNQGELLDFTVASVPQYYIIRPTPIHF